MRARFYDQLSLAAIPSAVSCARMFVQVTLTDWGARTALEPALNVVSTLTQHVVDAADDPEPWPEHLNLLIVRLVGLESSIGIEVWDTVTHGTLPSGIDPAALRSLTYPRNGGTAAWVELPVYATTPSGLPKRRKTEAPSSPPAERPDPALLQRVIDGLNTL